MKHSPLCSRDDGREIMFTAKDGDTKLRFVLSRELLDDACGDNAPEKQRKAWVKDRLPEILSLRTKAASAAPLNRVRIEEIA